MYGRVNRQSFDTFSGLLNEVRAASAAGGGTALTNAAGVIGLPNGTQHAEIIARNFSTAVVVKWALNPYLAILRSTDKGLTFTDYSTTGQQNPVDTTGVAVGALPTFANGGAMYIGAHVPFRGFIVDVSASVNAVVSTLTAQYWTGTAWTSLSPSDGTASGGATLAQDGNITWTMPAAGLWNADYLDNAVALGLLAPPIPSPSVRSAYSIYAVRPLYWTRLTVSAALTAGTKISAMFALNRSTAYAEMLENSLEAFRVQKMIGGIAAVELLTDAGTANAVVNVYTDSPIAQF
jgi:hypothetical protein